MTSSELRSLFLKFFEERGHALVPSSPLIPANDPTLLFTNAGMVQFKDVFLGREERAYTRAASSQRCVRAGGKHNDLENVGYTARHHTFFEMLGNFSFGDYFKRDAIRYAWEFLTGVLGLPPERLWITVYDQDTEAADIWLKEVGADPTRFSRIGTKDNFWSMGDTGPCGPCTEIFYDHGEHIPGGPPGSPDEDGDRYIEIWNLVFMQYDRAPDGTLTPLPKPSVDTGMGLERIAAVVQGVHSNYDIDLFRTLVKAAADLAHLDTTDNNSLRVLADHIRSCAFLITDGVLPSNEGRGYVLRRIIRRAIRHGYKLGIRDAFFYKLVAPLCAEMGTAYPELVHAQMRVTEVLKLEEERFFETIDRGMSNLLGRLESMVETSVANYVKANVWVGWDIDGQVLSHGHWCFSKPEMTDIDIAGAHAKQVPGLLLQRWLYVISASSEVDNQIQEIRQKVSNAGLDDWLIVVIDDQAQSPAILQENVLRLSPDDIAPYRIFNGNLAFILYDTFGFPLDLTQDVCREHGVIVDEAAFNAAMNRQRERARAASQFAADYSGNVQLDVRCEFTGYTHLSEDTIIVALLKDDQTVERLSAGDEGIVILAKTPFYGESGGQVGDRGTIRSGDAVFEVLDTQKQGGELILHIGRVVRGTLAVGADCRAEVDGAARQATALNHSATHLLHAALRRILGEHVTQKGSLVDPQRLRFDFSHFEPIKPEQLDIIERLVNEQIRANSPVYADIMAKDDAVKAGAMALFGEKYGDEVRVLRIGEFSTELCGGIHAERAGDIGLFKIVGESGVAAGVRRIEAVTGEAALDWIKTSERLVQSLGERVKAGREGLIDKVQQILERNRALEKELDKLKGKLASASGDDLVSQAVEIDGVKVLAAKIEESDPKALRDLVDQLRNKLGSAAIVLGTVKDGKVSLIAGVTQDQTSRIKAGDLVNAVATQVGGKGGGRPDLAQAGGTDPTRLDAALKSVPDWVRRRYTA
jgi:alanyl-tRNA synthetase